MTSGNRFVDVYLLSTSPKYCTLKGAFSAQGQRLPSNFQTSGGLLRGVQQPAKVWGSLKQWLHTGPLIGSQGQLTSCVLGTSLTGGPAQLGGLLHGRLGHHWRRWLLLLAHNNHRRLLRRRLPGLAHISTQKTLWFRRVVN